MGDYESYRSNVHGTRVSMQGRIIKGIGGFYYVLTENGTYTCKAKGVFRHDNTRPLVGDNVDIDVVLGEEMVGNVSNIRNRKNTLIRPNVANVDQAISSLLKHISTGIPCALYCKIILSSVTKFGTGSTRANIISA